MHLSKESMAPAIMNNLKQKAGVASPHWRRSDARSASPKSGQLLPISIRGFRVVIQPNEAGYQSEQTPPHHHLVYL